LAVSDRDNQSGGAVFLSVVIPAHNEERRLGPSLRKVLGFLSLQTYSSEVVVVENGSADDTYGVAERAAKLSERVRIIRTATRGKGLAVRLGMLAAVGEYRFLCDADLSMPIENVSRFLPPRLEGVDIAIASREAAGAIIYDEPRYRRMIGRWFNRLTRMVLLPGLRDTQCGFKCFTADAAECLFSRQILDGMAFDAEVLYIARLKGLRIAEVPIPWYFDPDSRVRLLKDSLTMGADLLAVRANARRGMYE
jgi:glycosyltransferase involved in cell wall biosynthesis